MYGATNTPRSIFSQSSFLCHHYLNADPTKFLVVLLNQSPKTRCRQIPASNPEDPHRPFQRKHKGFGRLFPVSEKNLMRSTSRAAWVACQLARGPSGTRTPDVLVRVSNYLIVTFPAFAHTSLAKLSALRAAVPSASMETIESLAEEIYSNMGTPSKPQKRINTRLDLY